MFDNMANMVILAGILIGAFHFPKELVLYRMVPGTAMGVLIGDLIYAWMAGRLARRTGRDDVTAMPLGLNAPSVFGMSFAVIGPSFLATHDAMLAWEIGMAVTVLVGVFKIGAFILRQCGAVDCAAGRAAGLDWRRGNCADWRAAAAEDLCRPDSGAAGAEPAAGDSRGPDAVAGEAFRVRWHRRWWASRHITCCAWRISAARFWR